MAGKEKGIASGNLTADNSRATAAKCYKYITLMEGN